MPITADTHVRLARPSRDLPAAERFWAQGLGLDVLYRSETGRPGEHDLVMLGLPGAGWHLELVGGPALAGGPRPAEEDLFVLYLDGPADDELVTRLERAGGTRVSAGPYWDRWGIAFADPDGYRLVLCTRAWSND
ncbi:MULTISPECIES: VOC family protein [unclassified Micromonospora]|uniref:VOC family protein n=1 Tax=unclassified Micromonospora TaxID=2617518 RepID=UPI001B371D90|nr:MULTISPECIES: VOC family protein [unclassified Micromonospora]MBQ1044843.1 VOC family protein [Micromonospora sp. C72]MBQ1054058.1 VOC family protein [Micromonospora sp. C32]